MSLHTGLERKRMFFLLEIFLDHLWVSERLELVTVLQKKLKRR